MFVLIFGARVGDLTARIGGRRQLLGDVQRRWTEERRIDAVAGERPAKVINIASVDGIFVNPGETYSYAASKAAVIHLTRRMATKLIKENINVTAIAPGAFKSDMNRAARDHADTVAKRIPARRIGTDEDMAGIAIYLASRAGDYVVGNTIAVDGGVVYANAGLEIAG